jgi:integrase/recombinase XerD
MTTLAPTLEAFFTERLVRQRRASPHTVASYRDTFSLLLRFIQHQKGKAPCGLDFSDLDAPVIGAFLDHLEVERHNGVATRNARLVAIHSLFTFAALRHPEHAELIARVLAIPPKRTERALVSFLSPTEIDALLGAPDRTSWTGRRDHALLVVAIQTGLRVSELVGLCCGDVTLDTGAHVRCEGKGRKERATPLTTATIGVLRRWLTERQGGPSDPVFPTRSGRPLSRDAVERLVAKYATAAERRCQSLAHKRVTTHVMRHTCAMDLRRGGVPVEVIALWLGHESTRTTAGTYLHADLALKEQALSRTTPPDIKPGRYRPPDALLAFLENL